MPLVKKRGLFETSRVVYLPTGEITLDPKNARREPDPDAMRELTASISKYGVLQPLTVRRRNPDSTGTGFELISGDRRLRAAKMIGLREVPCIVLDVGEEESAALVIVENIQRRDLDFIEEARALERLRALYGYSQEETARLVGRSQSAVANKLRILRLPAELLRALRDAGLTERHARALLRLPSERDMAAAVSRMIAEDMNVARAEEFIEQMLSGAAEKPEEARARKTPAVLLRDHRLYINTIERGAETMRRSGHEVSITSDETDERVVLTVTIAKRQA
jgi:ParB family chromosome partitioning protein